MSSSSSCGFGSSIQRNEEMEKLPFWLQNFFFVVNDPVQIFFDPNLVIFSYFLVFLLVILLYTRRA